MSDRQRKPESPEERRRLLRELLARRAAAPPAAAREIPLSVGQQALYFLHRMAPESAAYNVLFAARIRSPIDAEALEHAFARIVARHPSLRATFGPARERERGAEPAAGGEARPRIVQRIDPEARIALDRLAPDGDGEGLDEGRWLERLRAYARRPFDLARGPVLRVGLFRRGPEDHALLLVAHHIAVDFWSFALMLEELHRLLPALAAGEEIELEEPEASYADFVRWQRELLDGPAGERMERYWRRRLADAPRLELLTDRPRGALQAFAGDSHRFDLGPELTAALGALASARGATLFATLFAGLAALFHRLTGQRDLLLGSPIAGRGSRRWEGVVGYFANMLALRVGPRGEMSFGELVGAARDVTFEALEHGDYPFPLLVDRLGIERDPSRGPLFDVAFAVESSKMDRHGISGLLAGAPEARSRLAGLELESLPLSQQEGQFDLTFHLLETERSVGGLLMYDSSLFDAGSARRLVSQLATLLAGAVADPEAALAELPLLAEPERRQLLEGFNATLAEWPEQPPVHELVAAAARRDPEHPALVAGERSLSYGELLRRSRALAERLAGAAPRVDPETPIAVCAPRGIELVVGLLAVLEAGAPYLPLDPAYPDERLRAMLELGGVRRLLVVADEAGRFAGSQLDTHVLELEPQRERRDEQAPAAAGGAPRRGGAHPERTAYVIFTSGSTGRPKGVRVPHGALTNLVLWHRQAFGVGPDDRFAVTAAPGFDASVWELWANLAAGATLDFPSDEHKASGRRLLSWLAARRATLCFAPTPLAEAMLAQPMPAELALRTLFAGGAALVRQPPDDLPFPVINLYGPTETAVIATSARVPAASAGRRTPIGSPVANARAYVLDGALDPVAAGAVGELYLAGRGLARCYEGSPAATAASFLPDPFSPRPGGRLYRTGDLARHDARGELEFFGRVDDQVKLRGFRIELGEIEASLAALPGVSAAAAAVAPSPTGEQLVAWVVAARAIDEGSELLAPLAERLPEYMLPSRVLRLDALPLTAHGKVDRRRLLAELAAAPAPASRRAAEQTARARHAGGEERRLRREIEAIWGRLLGLESVDPDASFFDLGGHSLLVGELLDLLEPIVGRSIAAVEIFRFPTLRTLARHLLAGEGAAGGEEVAERPARRAEGAGEPIAIVGMAGRFPGADDVEALWELLREGREGVSFFSDGELAAAGVSERERRRADYVPAAAVLDGAERFDAAFFGFTPREAEILDPQQRLFLECAWHALEDAGCDPARAEGRIGVFAGLTESTYRSRHLSTRPEIVEALGDYQLTLANDKDFLPTRVSYKLDLRGPSVNVQTACSTSLVAVHMACRSLVQGECEMALAGGATLRLPQRAGYRFQAGMILSPDGHCRPYDAAGRGTVGGNGVGVVVLKPLSRALADGDPVRAVIRGSAINNDGSAKVGYTAPSVEGQSRVLAEALAAAAVEPGSIGYVEGHGTGTELGDPIEVAALNQAYAGAERVALGSIKSNLGHLDAAAGVAGLIKTVLALEHQALPPTLHFERPNPKAGFADGPFEVVDRLRPWPRGEAPRRAAVSSFGIGGTNAHAILEEAPQRLPRRAPDGAQLLVLSARSETALDAAGEALAARLEADPELPLDAVAWTLQAGRRAFAHRRALLCRDRDDAVAALADPRRWLSGRADGERPVAMLFPGQGAQYPGMGRDLYAAGGAFRRELDRLAEAASPLLGEDLRRVILAPADDERAAERLRRTALAQPALFAVELALAAHWRELGVEPAAVVGHSLGQYAAAAVAGVLAPEDALALVVERGRLIEALPEGGMLGVSLAAEALAARLGGELSLAAINAPELCVVSGPRPAIAALAAELEAEGIEHRPLHTSHAFHSAMIEPALDGFRRALSRVRLSPPRLPLAGDTSGRLLSAEEATDPETWVAHLRDTVRFGDAVAALVDELDPVFLEVGPGKTLATFARRVHPDAVALSSMRHPRHPADDVEVLLGALARLWLAGSAVDWRRLHGAEPPPKVSLPGYRFERRRHWIEPATQGAETAKSAPAALAAPASRASAPGPVADASGDRWLPVEAPPRRLAASGPWLLLTDDHGLGDALSARLALEGLHPVRVWAGSELRRLDADAYTVDPRRGEDWSGLLALLRDRAPRRVVMLWSAVPSPGADASDDEIERASRAARELGPAALERLLAALEERMPAQPIALEAVTAAGCRFADQEPGAVTSGERALAAAAREVAQICRRVPERLPFAGCRHLDVTPWRAADDSAVERVEEVFAELTAAVPGDGEVLEVAYHDDRRWVRAERAAAGAAGDPTAERSGPAPAAAGATTPPVAPKPAAVPASGGAQSTRPELATPFVAPRSATEQRVAAIWEEMLGIHPVGLDDDFFELGGHSLLGTRVLARLQDVYEIEIPLSQLFQRPTVAQLAELVEAREAQAREGAEEPAPERVAAAPPATEQLSDDEVDALLRELISEHAEEVSE